MYVTKTLTTKNKIIEYAIDLFSEKGYSETSMREIAQKCNIKASSIYNHFNSKEEILDTILDYYRKELNNLRMSDDTVDYLINNFSLEEIFIKRFLKILGATASRSIKNIIRLLLSELFRNPKVKNFYRNWYYNEKTVDSMKLFKKLQEKKIIKEINLELLISIDSAIINEFYHELFLYQSDGLDIGKLENKIKQEFDFFAELIKFNN